MCAKALPPILTILFLDTTITSMAITNKRNITRAKEIDWVDLNGEFDAIFCGWGFGAASVLATPS